MTHQHKSEPTGHSNPTPSDYINPEEALVKMKFCRLVRQYLEMVASGKAVLPGPGEKALHEMNERSMPGTMPDLIFKVLVAIPTDEQPFNELWWK